MRANNNRELDINNLLLNGNSPIATHLNDNTTDVASLPLNVVITPPSAINNRATNYTKVDQLKVQGNKSGLIRNLLKGKGRNLVVESERSGFLCLCRARYDLLSVATFEP